MRGAILALSVLLSILALARGQSQPPEHVPHRMQLPPEVRAWYRNETGDCVQDSIGMCGIWQNVPSAYTLLWNTVYGPAVRGGSGPSRVESYADRRGIRIYNVTGSTTWDWMKWAAKTGRFAAIGAAANHFQTLYAWDPERNVWYVCDNNSPQQVDEYTWPQFRRLHLASGQWIVVLDYTLCPLGGAIDSVLDTKLRTRRLADLFDPVFAQYQTRALCRLCGHELHIDSLRISQSQVLHGSLMSPTWQQAVNRIHQCRQQQEPSP